MFSSNVEVKGHLIDSLILPKILDEILHRGGTFEIEEIEIGKGKSDLSYARVRVEAPTEEDLQSILNRIGQIGAKILKQKEIKIPGVKKMGKRQFLMCSPQYYDIQYVINPWMDVKRRSYTPLAKGQWQRLYQILAEELKAEVLLIPPAEGLPDMVFTANGGLVYGKLFIPSNFRYKERQPESKYFIRWFKERGYKVVPLPEGTFFEGAGDALFLGEDLFAGYRFRSDIDTHAIISEIIGKRVLSLELMDDRFYHLDTCFCPLDRGRAIYFPGAFDPYAVKLIEEYIPEPIPVSLEEALNFACNAVIVEKSVIIPRGCLKLAERLGFLGYKVYEVDLNEFIKAGGAAKCLTLEL